MADKGDEQRPQGLTCPLCLESFKNPTLLRCGHTFCKACLENYDQQHNGVDHMECPVCRKRTKLEENRIAGLSPNFSLQGLQDELHLDEHLSPNFCVLHKTESKNIFCEVCENFICIACFIKDHQGHKILRKEDLREQLKKKKIALIQESKTRKPLIEKTLNDAEQMKEKVYHHLGNMEKEIRDTFAKKVNTLQECENKLIKEVQILQRDSDKQSESFIAHQRQLIDDIDVSVGILEHTGTSSEHLKDHDLIEHHLQCIALENSLKKPSNKPSVTQVQVAMNFQFCPCEKHVGLGCIQQGGTAETVKGQQVKKSFGSTKGRIGQGVATSYGQQVKKSVGSTKGWIGQGGEATTSKGQQVKKPAGTKGRIGQGGTATTSNGQQVKKPVASTKGRIGQGGTATLSNSQQVKKSVAGTNGWIGQGGTATSSSQQGASVNMNCLIGQGGSAKRSIQQAEMAASVNTTADEMQASTSAHVGGIPGPAVKNNSHSLIIVKEAGNLYEVFGMAALSENSVVVGYGPRGSQCLFVSGENRPFLNGAVEDVYDIACLTNGRSAVMGKDAVCRVYDRQGTHCTGMQYFCSQALSMYSYRYYPQLCSDQHDNIYIVARKPKIFIFQGNSPHPQRVVHIGTSIPYQICVTKAGAMITCSDDAGKSLHLRRSVTVYNREGHAGSSIKSSNVMSEYMYAAVDSRDRVLIARLRDGSDMLRLARYTLKGTTLTKEVTFRQLKLSHSFDMSFPYCYIVSLNPNMIAFSTLHHLYFIELPV